VGPVTGLSVPRGYPHSVRRRRTWIIIGVLLVCLLAGGAGIAYWIVHEPVADVHNDSAPFTLTSDPTTTEPTTSTGDPSARFGPAWPMYGLTPARTRNASDLTQIAPPFKVVWKSTPLGVLEYPPSYERGVLYLTTDAGWASARDVFTGKLLWSRHFKPLVGEPALYRHRVYFGSYDQRVYALDEKNGHTVWSTPVGAKIESPPVIADGRVYMSDLSGAVRALDADSGKVLWTFHASGAVKHGPALADGHVFFGDYAGVMYSLRASDGHLAWRTQTNGLSGGYRHGNFYATPAVAYGRVYIGNTDGKVYSFVEGTGQVAWTSSFSDWVYGSPAVSNGLVFAVAYDGTVAALNAKNGTRLWSRRLQDRSLSSATIIGRFLYVSDLGNDRGAAPGHVYAINPGTGKVVWTFNDGKYHSVIAAAGRLIVAGAIHLYALKPE
jgi:outer membrane protein assembly factor BamB